MRKANEDLELLLLFTTDIFEMWKYKRICPVSWKQVIQCRGPRETGNKRAKTKGNKESCKLFLTHWKIWRNN